MRSDRIKLGLNHLQSLICTYSADNLRPLMKNVKSRDSSSVYISGTKLVGTDNKLLESSFISVNFDLYNKPI